MAIKQAEIENLLKEGFPDADIEIQDLAGDDNHFSAKIRSSKFKGKNRVQQHQMVYKAGSFHPRQSLRASPVRQSPQ